MLKEDVTYRLASSFMNEYKKHGSFLFSMRTVDKSKWWVHFERASGYRSISGWKPEDHVKSCFEKFGKILPFRLYGKTAIGAWEEYNHRYSEIQKNDFVTQMLNTFKKIKKSKGNYSPDYYEENKILLKRKVMSIHFLSLSKEFRRINNEEHYYDNDLLDIKKIVVCKNKNIYNKMKEVFGDDFY